MKRHLSVTLSFLLGSFIALVESRGLALAQAPLKPVQHVYPDSTLEEIQQAIDNGGTVYFERLTKTTNQYGEYYQVASTTPDLPPTTANPPKGFNIGKNGKDVDIIGVLGPRGERPKINGGTVTFRIGYFPSFNFVGFPVSFKIENLELFNPDIGMAAQLNSRVGIWVGSMLGARSAINNCKITITGKESDPGHMNNHSVSIWFYLPTNQPQPPPSGAVIDITNNTVMVTKAHEGLHADSFWPVTPGFTPPRVFISNNSVDVSSLGGYQNKMGTNGATLAAAIVLSGNVPNSIVTNNTIRGDGRSPGLTPRVESLGILLGAANAGGDVLANVTVVGNDFSAFTGDFQLRVDEIVSWSTVARNFLGPASTAGVMCSGHDNWFDKNHFYGDYPGWDGPGDGPGLVWFTKTSAGNRLTSTVLNRTRRICGQVHEDTEGANLIPGYDKCQEH